MTRSVAQAQRSIKAALEAGLQNAWRVRGVWACTLWPLAKLVWWAHLTLERWRKPPQLEKSRLGVPLVVVGNVYVGGVGKTPIVVALVEHLQSQGLQIGVIARGYGTAVSGEQVLEPGGHASRFGDEPALIQERTGVPLVVGVDRLRAAQLLLARFPKTEVIVSDDGLQRLKHCADAVLCVFDERGVGNGWTLPAGPLREPWPRKLAAHTREWVIHSQVIAPGPRSPLTNVSEQVAPTLTPGFVAKRRLRDVARNAKGETLDLRERSSRELGHPGGSIVALAGIAKPAQFFAMLCAMGLELAATLCASDHASASELMGLLKTVMRPGEPEPTVLCTQKDAQKLWTVFPKAWSVSLEVTLDPLFLEEFDLLLHERLSSPHGHETH